MTKDHITYGRPDAPPQTLFLIVGVEDRHTDLDSRAADLLSWLRENVHPETWSRLEQMVVAECVEVVHGV